MSARAAVGELRRHMAEAANANAAHVARGRLMNAVLLLGIGDDAFYVTVREGCVSQIEEGPKLLRAVDLSIRASSEAWAAFWQPVPRPGFYDIMGMVKGRHATIEGDVGVLMRHLRFVKDLLATPRGRLDFGRLDLAHG